MPARLAALAFACLLAFGCDKPQPAEPQPPEEPKPQTTTAEPATQTSGDKAWAPAAADALDEGQAAQLEKAKAAQKALGGTLVKALTDSVAKDGFAASIEFCRGEAPGVAETVAKEHGVKIGRTSHKLRNPQNTAPDWAADAVANAEPGMKVFAGPDGELGVLSPITLAPVCVNCHGATDKLAEGVETALKEKYPEDQATGFAEGDLRGWFWVEVPAG